MPLLEKLKTQNSKLQKMGKVALIKIGEGNFKQGFSVSLQVCQENGGLPEAEVEGRLPPEQNLEGFYITWQTGFRFLKTPYQNDRHRRSAASQDSADDDWGIVASNVATSEDVEQCQKLFQTLASSMRDWLHKPGDEGWQKIRERLIREFAKNEEIRVAIKARSPMLWKLPWQVWDLLEDRPDVGISFSLPEFEKTEVIENSTSDRHVVRILAVLGESSNIDTDPDREAIASLPGAEAVFLEQPSSQELIETLRDKRGWDIFFFAGHSRTEGETGKICLNDREVLEIEQFKHALKQAIRQGLKLAIFNSCDGLGLARNLAELNLPAILVMKEQVPDRVAQKFVAEFLREYSQGEFLYTAVRRAQERLEEFQDLPGCTWLPIVCQNPAVVPPTWAELGGVKSGDRQQNQQNRIIPFWPVKPQWIFGALLTSAIASFYAAPKVAVLANSLGHSQRRAGQLYDARFFYNIATLLNPAKGIYFYNLGLVCDDDLGDRLCAIQNYEQGAMLGNAESMAELARLQIVGDRQEVALKTVGRCLDLAKYDGVKASCQTNLAWIRWQQGRLPEAEENLRQAIALREDSPHAHCLLALVLEARGREKEALVAWQNSLQYSSGNIHIPEQDRCIAQGQKRLGYGKRGRV